MSVHRIGQRTAHVDEKLAILEAVRQRDNVRLSALAEAHPFDGADIHAILRELREDDLVSACPIDGDLVVTSLPRLRGYERTKLHRLLYN